MTDHELQVWIFTHAQETLSAESAWLHFSYGAEDIHGNQCSEADSSAVKWSLMGSLMRARYAAQKIDNRLSIFSNFDEVYEKFRRVVIAQFPDRYDEENMALTEFGAHHDTTFAEIEFVFGEARAALGLNQRRMTFSHTTTQVAMP